MFRHARIDIAASLLAAAVCFACGSDVIEPGVLAKPAGLAEPAQTLRVESVLRPTLYEAVGTVRSRATATVSSQVAGRIVEVSVDAGTNVEAGLPLARIDDQEFKARLEQARSALRAAEAGRDQANTHHDRTKKLLAVNAATEEQLEVALLGARQARANVDSARQRLREAEIAHEHTRVTSPIGGVVDQRLVDPGDLALPGKALFVIHHPEDLRLEASVREGAIDRIQMGQKVAVELVAADQSVMGIVSEIVPSADSVTRSFQVKVTLPPAQGVYPGMFGKLGIPIGERDTILLPRAAIIRVGQLTTVQVKVNDRWERRYVSLGEETDGEVEVLAGISAGEIVGWNPAES